jgi:subtilisin family serine protease
LKYIVKTTNPAALELFGKTKYLPRLKMCILESDEGIDIIRSQPGVDSVTPDAPMEQHGFFVQPMAHFSVWTNPALPQVGTMQYALAMMSRTAGYYRNSYTGLGVDIYVIDLGVMATHQEFASGPDYDKTGPRASLLYSYLDPEDVDYEFSGTHGTSVASQAAGRTCGAARDARIKFCFVNPMAEGLSTYAEASDAIIEHHRQKLRDEDYRPSILNTSLGLRIDSEGDPAAAAMWESIIGSIAQEGILHVTSVGNNWWLLEEGGEGYMVAPAIEEEVIGVGATTKDNELAWYTNYGPGLNVFAPGHDSVAALGTKDNRVANPDTQYVLFSGTSSAAPFVTGVLACAMEADGLPMFLGWYWAESPDYLAPSETPGETGYDSAANKAKRRLQVMEYQSRFLEFYTRPWEPVSGWPVAGELIPGGGTTTYRPGMTDTGSPQKLICSEKLAYLIGA